MGKDVKKGSSSSSMKDKKKERFAGHSTFHKDSKRTKKFKSKHLKDEIENRRRIQKIKGRKNKKSNEEEEEEEEEEFKYDSEDEEEERKEDEKYLEDSDEEEEKNEEEEEENGEEEEMNEEEEEAISKDFAQHKKELEELRKNDPDFVKFLEENDSSLLEFGREDDEYNEDEEGEELDGEEGQSSQKVLTNSMINTMLKGAKSGKLQELKKLMVAFRCGCYSTEGTSKAGQDAVLPYEIAGDKTFAHLMSVVFKNSNFLFQLFAGPSNKTWGRIERVVKAFFLNYSHYIATCANNEALLRALDDLEPYVPWLAKLKGPVSKKLLKAVLDRWSEHKDLDIKASAFRSIREMAAKVPYPFINSCYKGVYLNYVRESKFYNPSSFKAVQFMADCVVELYLLDPIVAYQHAFVYIRQLAIHLRNFIQSQTKDALSHVYSWQFINSIRVWSSLLSQHTTNNSGKEKASLDQLAFPLIQVILGTIRANGSPRYYPLRFICIEFINNIAASSQSLVNTSSYILEVLGCADLKKKAKASGSSINYELTLKASKSQRASSHFQDFIFGKVQLSLLQYFNAHATSISFPEMVIPIVNHLKKFNKKCTVPHWKRKITQVIEQLEKNSKFIINHRTQIDFSPKNFEKTKSFLANAKTPLGQYYRQLKSNEEQIKQLKKYDYEEEKEDESSDEDEEEQEQEQETPVQVKEEKSSKRKKSKQTKRPAKKQARGEEGKKDVVEDFNFSDEDE